jgi:YegS/Rv2252/BmrU family lipid kinase
VERRACLIVNPAAGGGRAARVLPEVEARLAALGIEHRTRTTTGLEHADELARQAAEDGEVAVTLGGDGLVGCVAGALRGLDGALMAVLPGGRGNDFVRVSGIPQDPVDACDVVAHGTPTPVDVGDVDGRTFIGIASLGFDSDANRIANDAPPRLGPLVYAYGALRALAAWRHATFEVEVDGERRTFSGWSVAAANSGAYGGGMLLAPGARLDDGELDIVLTAATGKLQFLRSLPRVFKGTHIELESVTVLRGRSLTVAADRPFAIYADGDPIGALPATITADPGAVTVLLPAA